MPVSLTLRGICSKNRIVLYLYFHIKYYILYAIVITQ